jgi:pimeloyl-ACP methyl ester carboxylesterase
MTPIIRKPLASRAAFKSNDLEALVALMSSENFMDVPGYEDLLPNLKMPCLFFVGENEWEFASAQQTVKRMPNAKMVSFPGLNHVQACFRIDLVLPHIIKFLEALNPG